MSTFNRYTKHPVTGKWENALWMDNYFDHYHYGVKFTSGVVIDPWETPLKCADLTDEEAEKLNT